VPWTSPNLNSDLSLPGFDAGFRIVNQKNVLHGGDAVFFERNRSDHASMILLVDAMGNGAKASAATATLWDLLRIEPALCGCTPHQLMHLLNSHWQPLFLECGFLVAVAVLLSGDHCEIAIAGDPYGVLRATSGGFEQVQDRLSFIGVSPALQEVGLRAGSQLVIFSDGVTDAWMPDGSQIGIDNVLDILNQIGRASTSAEVVDELFAAVEQTAPIDWPFADASAVCIQRRE